MKKSRLPIKRTLPATDLFVVLDRAFRRRARECAGCSFTLPYRLPKCRVGEADWSVAASAACSDKCKLILEELVAQHQGTYRLPAMQARKGLSARDP
jgi:hypothetical protein